MFRRHPSQYVHGGNTSNQRSAFIDFRQNNNATPRAVSEGGMMIESML
ncbi:hypothetical protein [Mycobacterium paraseoulense]|nr:hypothetical protein [Mycobacterium paraseoulense]MCV7393213.1 hypothetical protein [Mycobacterium paraseoulense]